MGCEAANMFRYCLSQGSRAYRHTPTVSSIFPGVHYWNIRPPHRDRNLLRNQQAAQKLYSPRTPKPRAQRAHLSTRQIKQGTTLRIISIQRNDPTLSIRLTSDAPDALHSKQVAQAVTTRVALRKSVINGPGRRPRRLDQPLPHRAVLAIRQL